MTEVHQVLYPPKENDTSIVHRRYDALERLVAWTVRQEEYFLVFRVESFREESRKNGKVVHVPERIECRFSHTDIDPDSAFADAVNYEAFTCGDSSANGLYQWDAIEPDVEVGPHYNAARCFDPTPGRWLTDNPLAFEASDDNLYRYPEGDCHAGNK